MATDLFDLKGKTALVTGGTHGIGMSIAIGLADAGAKIVVNDLSVEKLENAKKEYKKKGIDAATFLFDVTDEDAVDKGITAIEKEVGPIDILVNNA
ncbi:MAG: Gluconate 5-dehydrogenase, partial [Bacteroidetes bacterium]|nr:Gluconate 5-dehydrogenase [Bacteroidota bacterium]